MSVSCLSNHVLNVYSDFGWGERILRAMRQEFPLLVLFLEPWYALDLWRLEVRKTDKHNRIVNFRTVQAAYIQLCVETN